MNSKQPNSVAHQVCERFWLCNLRKKEAKEEQNELIVSRFWMSISDHMTCKSGLLHHYAVLWACWVFLSLTQEPKERHCKIYCDCKTYWKDLPSLLRVWAALWRNQQELCHCKLLDLGWNHTGFEGVKALDLLQALTLSIPRIAIILAQSLQHYNSPADWARKLFKRSMDSASLLVEIEKNFFRFGFVVLWGGHHKWGCHFHFIGLV